VIRAIDNGENFKTKLDKRNDFAFPIVTFISSNIPAATSHRVYISQLIPYYRTCAQYSYFLDMINQEWTTQSYRQHLVHKAQDGDKKENKETQNRKLNL
jgi:hypothetical protein